MGVVLAGVAGACSLTTSLDGLTGGSVQSPDSSTTEDAGGPHADGSVIVPPEDGGAPDDAALPSADASDAASPIDATPFCASQAAKVVFCDDFDEDGGLAVPGTWDQVSSDHGVASVSSLEAVSPPGSMQIVTTAGASTYDCAAYRAFTKYAAKPYLFTFSFEIFVAQVPTTTGSEAVLSAFQLYNAAGVLDDLQLECTYDSALGALDVNFSENSHLLDGGAPYISHVSTAHLPIAQWTQVTLALTLEDPSANSSTNSATWTLGTSSTKFEPTLTVSDGTPEILTGITYVTPGDGAWTVYFDNVTFDATLL